MAKIKGFGNVRHGHLGGGARYPNPEIKETRRKCFGNNFFLTAETTICYSLQVSVREKRRPLQPRSPTHTPTHYWEGGPHNDQY